MDLKSNLNIDPPDPSAQKGRLDGSQSSANRAFLLGTYLNSRLKEQAQEQLKELESLCDTYGLNVVGGVACPLRSIDPGTFLGKGKVEEIRELCQELKVDFIVFDEEISPQQQRNLEKALQTSVLDRTELILAVFAQRAQTKEARIQIQLASFRYQLPRLRRLWTHLGRQRTGGSGGKGGFLKGEGEAQIEIDRRILRREISRLEKELEEVRKTRATQRAARKRRGIPTFALIGYTNAGKSTLLNALTDAGVFVEDKLFATLDTATRKFSLPNHQEILLIDTVGFIRKIPHLLVAAFKSTLEESVQADILLHLIDVSHPSAEMQARATFEVLKELDALNRPMITVLNKIDREGNLERIERLRIEYPKTIAISALEKRGLDQLQEMMIQEIARLRKVVHLRIPQSHYVLVSELMREGKVLSCEYEGNDILLEVEIPRRLEHKTLTFEVSE